MKVREVMSVDVVTTTPDTSLKAAAGDLATRSISGMPVVDDEGKVVGVLSEADILAKVGNEQESNGLLRWFLEPTDSWIAARFDAVTVADAMTCPATTILPQTPVAEAASTMLEEDVNRLPVVSDEGKLVGLVSRSDLIRAFARTDAEIQQEIEVDVLRRVMWINPNDVQVTVNDGVVKLTGHVPSRADADLLPRFTRRVPGVVDVDSTVTSR